MFLPIIVQCTGCDRWNFKRWRGGSY